MSFNRKDLQDDDDFNFDDDFSFDDDQPNGDEFKFDDEPADVVLDDDKDAGFGFEGEDMPALDDEPGPQRSNRTFIIIAGVMILLFLAGLAAVLFLATRPTGPTDIDLTRTAIVVANATTFANATETEVANAQLALAATQTALAPTATPLPPTNTPVPTITPTPLEPTIDPTQAAANALLTQVAFDATQTAIAAQITPTQEPINADTVALTATALAALLGQGGGPTEVALGGATPTQEGGIGGPLPSPTALPQTGFFDELGTGGNFGILLVMALGLIGIIGVSRAARAANKG
ncbi:MAG: hypothetical protein R3E39_25440 [Anaerolineae bacterium]